MATKLLRLRSQFTQSYTTNSSLLKTKFDAIQNRLNIFEVPERFKGTVVEKWILYWRGLTSDYRDVFLGVIKQTKEKPFRATIYGGLASSVVYSFKHNPTETDFIGQLRKNINEIVLVDPVCQNPVSSQYLTFVERCYNEGIVRRLNVGIFSLLWLDDYDKTLRLYKATCSYTQPELLKWHKRIIDFGFLGTWWNIEKKMKDYDINEENV